MSPKKILMMLSLMLCWLTGTAQDVIVNKDGTSLLGKVVEVTDTEVKYRKADNPDGPIYTLKTADLMRINYENGQSDIFAKDGMTPSTVLPSPTGNVKDTNLLTLYKKEGLNYSLPKRLKLTAFIGGPILIATGIALMFGADFKPSKDPALFFAGAATTTIGVAWVPTFYFMARHKQKQIDELELMSAPLYRQDIFETGGKSLSIGVDYMADRVKTRTLGLGMTFKF